ncbi:MAG TPA: IPT/TIG domain-containing protein [Thermoleophilaceae bacterium]|jgi:hypothetical protein
MRRRAIQICLALLALTVLAVPAAADAKKKKAKKPVVTRVSPMRLSVGGKVTIRGKNFSSNRRHNTVVFRGPGRRTVLVKPKRASRRKLVVVVPKSVGRAVGKHDTARFKLRVLVNKTFGGWTRKRLSPVVVTGNGPKSGGGSGGGGGGGGTAPAPAPAPKPKPVAPTCIAGDQDGDLLAGSLEKTLGTDPCKKDTDGDGVEDGFEYRSAVDLNNDNYQDPNNSLPYPGKRPYPNPLDPSDGNTDYDGDSLSQKVEQKLWKYAAGGAALSLSPCDSGVASNCFSYSDGLQHSIYHFTAGQGDRHFPALAAAGYAKAASFISWAGGAGYRDVFIDDHGEYGQGGSTYGIFDTNLNHTESAQELNYYDFDGDGFLSDEERDEDADGLTNFDENTGVGRMNASWWNSCYSDEAPYYVQGSGTDPTDSDSDGDNVRDGADDQDHDDVPNMMELSRVASFNKFGAVYPNDPLEGSGDDRKQECVVSTDVTDAAGSGTDDQIFWHASAYGRVNPFNPCLPFRSSRTCNRHPGFGDSWAPFDQSPDWYALN